MNTSHPAGMRVLHFGKFPARLFGGIETHVKGLTEGLAAAGVDVTNLVYDLGRAAGDVEENVVNGVRIVAVPCRRTVASLAIAPLTLPTVSRLSRARPFDISHAHFPDPLAFAAMPWTRQAARVASWHSDIVRQRFFGALYGAVARLFDPLDAVAGATATHLDSEQLKAFRPRQRYVVPYGIDLARFVLTPAVEEQVARLRADVDHRPIVFALGRHVYYKGFEVLVNAMRDVDAVLLLGGEGPLTPALRERARQTIGLGEVRFVGRIENADLPAYYHACAVYCMPSLATSEAFGLVQVEAMACGRPIVNCWLNNAVNLVSPDSVSGLTVEPGDVSSLAAAINCLLQDATLRAHLGAGGRERVAQRFSMQTMIDATLAMYDQVLATRGL